MFPISKEAWIESFGKYAGPMAETVDEDFTYFEYDWMDPEDPTPGVGRIIKCDPQTGKPVRGIEIDLDGRDNPQTKGVFIRQFEHRYQTVEYQYPFLPQKFTADLIESRGWIFSPSGRKRRDGIEQDVAIFEEDWIPSGGRARRIRFLLESAFYEFQKGRIWFEVERLFCVDQKLFSIDSGECEFVGYTRNSEGLMVFNHYVPPLSIWPKTGVVNPDLIPKSLGQVRIVIF